MRTQGINLHVPNGAFPSSTLLTLVSSSRATKRNERRKKVSDGTTIGARISRTCPWSDPPRRSWIIDQPSASASFLQRVKNEGVESNGERLQERESYALAPATHLRERIPPRDVLLSPSGAGCCAFSSGIPRRFLESLFLESG